MTFNNFEMDSKIVLDFIISEPANETELIKDSCIYVSLQTSCCPASEDWGSFMPISIFFIYVPKSSSLAYFWVKNGIWISLFQYSELISKVKMWHKCSNTTKLQPDGS